MDPLPHREIVRRLRRLGCEGPYGGGSHLLHDAGFAEDYDPESARWRNLRRLDHTECFGMVALLPKTGSEQGKNDILPAEPPIAMR